MDLAAIREPIDHALELRANGNSGLVGDCGVAFEQRDLPDRRNAERVSAVALFGNISDAKEQTQMTLILGFGTQGLVTMVLIPFPVPIQAICVGDRGRYLHVCSAQYLLYSYFNPKRAVSIKRLRNTIWKHVLTFCH